MQSYRCKDFSLKQVSGLMGGPDPQDPSPGSTTASVVFILIINVFYTAQKVFFSTKDFFSKCDQIRRNLRIWSHLLNTSFMENFIFCAVLLFYVNQDLYVNFLCYMVFSL